jgi:hypothetical protein
MPTDSDHSPGGKALRLELQEIAKHNSTVRHMLETGLPLTRNRYLSLVWADPRARAGGRRTRKRCRARSRRTS